MLPGTNRAADRFVRASFYINAVPKMDDPLVAVAAVFSVVRNVSTPYGHHDDRRAQHLLNALAHSRRP